MPVGIIQQVMNHLASVFWEMKCTAGILSLLLSSYLDVNLLFEPAEPVGPGFHGLRYWDRLSSALPWEQSEVKKQERCVWRSLVSVILWKGVERCNTNLVHSYCATHDELTAGKKALWDTCNVFCRLWSICMYVCLIFWDKLDSTRS